MQVSVKLLLLYPHGNSNSYPVARSLCGPQTWNVGKSYPFEEQNPEANQFTNYASVVHLAARGPYSARDYL
jgi:hypothetical protein